MCHTFSPIYGIALVAVSLIACGAPPGGSAIRTAPATTEQGHDAASPKTHLSNGLLVHNVQRTLDETVAVQLWLPAGARYEGPAPAGVAAAVAELTRRSAASQLPSTASLLAWVEPDATVFALVTTPADLDETLGIMSSAIKTLDTSPAHIEAGRHAHEAHAATLRAAPGRHVIEALLAEAYSPNGLGRAPLGGDPAAWTPTALSDFHSAHYGPRGAHLVIVGPEPDSTSLDRARSHWGRWTGETKPRPVEPPASAPPRIRVDRSETDGGRIRVAIRLTLPTPREAAAYDLVAQLLQTPGTGRIAKAAHAHGIQLTTARSFVLAPVGPGQLVLALDGDPDDVDRIWSVAAQALGSLRELPPSPSELVGCRDTLLAADARRRATPDSYAERIGRRLLRWPRESDGADWRNAVATIEADELGRFARALLHKSLLTAVVTAPRSKGAEDDGFWAEALAEHLHVLEGGGPVSKAAGRVELRPGLTVVAHPMPQAGMVAIHVTVSGGTLAEGAHELGVGHMAASLWDSLASKVHVTVNADTVEATLITNPGAIEGDLVDMVAGLSGERWSPAVFEAARGLASARTRALLHKPALWARTLAAGQTRRPVSEQLTALDQMGASAVRPWFETHIAGAETTVAVVGDVTPDRAFRAVRVAFSGTTRSVSGVSLRASDPAPPQIHRATDGGPAHRWLTFQVDVQALEDRATLAVIEALLQVPPTGVELEVHDALAAGRGRWAVGVIRGGGEIEAATLEMKRRLETLRAGPLPEPIIRQATQRAMARETLRLRHPTTRARWLAEQARSGRALTGLRAVALWRAALGRVTSSQVHDFAKSKIAQPVSEIRVEPKPNSALPTAGGAQ